MSKAAFFLRLIALCFDFQPTYLCERGSRRQRGNSKSMVPYRLFRLMLQRRLRCTDGRSAGSMLAPSNLRLGKGMSQHRLRSTASTHSFLGACNVPIASSFWLVFNICARRDFKENVRLLWCAFLLVETSKSLCPSEPRDSIHL